MAHSIAFLPGGAADAEQQDSDRTSPHYRSLNSEKREIRVLTVYPGMGLETIDCDFQYVSIKTKPKPHYETISYCWGDASERGTVHLNGQPLDVPFSAERALRRMRLADQNRALWIDAVCINQQDAKERGHQVAFMQQIYANGIRNLIWLGEDDGHTEKALRDVQLLLDDLHYVTEGFTREIAQVVPLTFDLPDLTALEHLYSDAWFYRLWVVQEAVLSTENICFRGPFSIPLLDVVRTAWRLDRAIPTLTMILSAENLGQFIDPIFGTWPQTVVSNYASVMALFIYTRRFQATDPRDHVFAILGLLTHYTWHRDIPAVLLPDYTRSTCEVFRDAARIIIEDSGDLTVLLYATGLARDDGWLSWVPKWHDEDFQFLKFPDSRADNRMRMQLGNDCGIDADSLVAVGLIVEAVELTHIEMAGDYWTRQNYIVANVIGPARAMADQIKGLQEERDREATVACTLTRSTRPPEFGGLAGFSPRLDAQQCVAMYRAYLEFSKVPGDRSPGDPPLAQMSEQEQLAKDFFDVTWMVCDRRRLFRTRSFLGIGPPAMMADDVVAILYGASEPFILRLQPHAGKHSYRLVGHCYVHGIMDGEFVRANRGNGENDITFQLR